MLRTVFDDCLENLQVLIGLKFKNLDWLYRALAVQNRLDFIGDRLLIVALEERVEELFTKNFRPKLGVLVSNKNLCRIARSISLHLCFSAWNKEEVAIQDFYSHKFAADVIEALIGAAWKDQGESGLRSIIAALFAFPLNGSSPFIREDEIEIPQKSLVVLLPKGRLLNRSHKSSFVVELVREDDVESVESRRLQWSNDDPRVHLDQLCFQHLGSSAEYKTEDSDGRELFWKVTVSCLGLIFCCGVGESRNLAEQAAAAAALKKIQRGKLRL